MPDVDESFSELDEPGDAWLAKLREADASAAREQFGTYTLLREVGRGGQGIVFEAESPNGERVALKRLIGGVFASANARARLEREVRAARRVDHAAIVSVRDVLDISGSQALVFDWVEGEPLSHWAQRDPAVDEVIGVFEAIADALRCAHAAHILHRDLKPSNILVDAQARPHLVDFGLAKFVDADDTALTRSSAFLGTLSYAAPEQLEGRSDIDERADVYALGRVLHETLSRSPPPSPPSLAQALARVEARPASLHVQRPDVPPALDTVIAKATHPDRACRYATAAELHADLVRVRAHQPVRARAPGFGYDVRRLTRMHRVPVAAAAVALVTLLAWTVHAHRQRSQIDAALREAKDHAATRSEVLMFFTHDVLGRARHAGGGDLSVDELLQHAEARLAQRFESRPLVEAAVREAVAGVAEGSGEVATAELHLGRAVELARSGGADEATIARYRNAHVMRLIDIERIDEARTAAPELAATWSRLAPESSDHSAALLAVARLASWDGEHTRARALATHGLEILDVDEDGVTALEVHLISERARAALALGDTTAAFADASWAHKVMLRDHEETHVALTDSIALLGEIHLVRGEADKAAEAFRHVDHIRVSAWGDDYDDRAESLEALARADLARGNAERAATLARAALRRLERNGDWTRRLFMETQATLGAALTVIGRTSEARDILEDSHAGNVDLLGRAHPLVRQRHSALDGH